MNYSLSSSSGREPCPYAAMNCVLKYHGKFSVKQMSTVILPPLLFIPKPLRPTGTGLMLGWLGDEESSMVLAFKEITIFPLSILVNYLPMKGI